MLRTLLLGHHNFFPPTIQTASIIDLANKIGRSLILSLGSHFLSLTKLGSHQSVEDLLYDWFTFEDTQASSSRDYHDVLRRYKLIVAQHGTENQILSMESLLYMMEWAITEPDIKDSIPPSPATSLPLLQLVLHFNDKVLKNIASARKSYTTADPENQLQAMLLGLSFPQNDLQNRNFAQLFQTQNYKLALMLDYLERTPKYSKLYEKMLEDFHCTDKQDFFQALTKAVTFGINKKGGWTIIEVATGANFEKHTKFLNCLSIFPNHTVSMKPAEDEEVTPDDFKALRQKPLLFLEEGKYQVISELFLTKFAYNGVTFYLSDLVTAEPGVYLSGGSFPGHWRQDFIEGELTYSVFRNIFETQSAELVTGEMFKQRDLSDSEPDHYTRRGNTIFLTESKDVFIPAEDKMSYSYDRITEKLSKDKKGKRDRFEKAAFQLAKNIGRIAKRQLPVTSYNVKDMEVFPILLVHDSVYSAPGLNFWVDTLFQKELRAVKMKEEFNKVAFLTIHPLTIIEIDTLVLIQDNLRDGSLDLEDLLRKYHKFIHQPPGFIVNAAQAEAHVLKTTTAFSDFVVNHILRSQIVIKDNTYEHLLDKMGVV